MKKILITVIVLLATSIFCEEKDNRLIFEIIADVDNYKNKEVTLNLRLKYIDRIFEKIIFYDSENADIEFDISGKEKRKELSDNLINIHEGMLYRVRFSVIGAGTIGGLTGDLHEFVPLIIDKIPVE